MQKVISLAIILILILTGIAVAETEIIVSGTGTLNVPADRCSITLGVSVKDTSAINAQSLANEKLAAVREACINAGIDKDAIVTDCIRVGVYDDSFSFELTESDGSRYYEAASTITMYTDDFSIAAAVIDSGIAAGADTVNGISFSLSDPSVYNIQILNAACEDARAKAEILAASMALRIDSVKSIAEGYTYSYEEASAMFKNDVSNGSTDTVIDGANISVSTSITVTFIAE